MKAVSTKIISQVVVLQNSSERVNYDAYRLNGRHGSNIHYSFIRFLFIDRCYSTEINNLRKLGLSQKHRNKRIPIKKTHFKTGTLINIFQLKASTPLYQKK
jgi:hypothetical protein